MSRLGNAGKLSRREELVGVLRAVPSDQYEQELPFPPSMNGPGTGRRKRLRAVTRG